ncbi:nuclear transport factor 2 family protein [Limisalsivibrio acetivorans]|uniref:nuclear transport factor 2 family protein n=1 Tax=Limisalsivibrio acetivorans TaxID=1304888 RepID=UPI0003B622D1|nr:nuclear transport factor 2 family protein [Limisalsivibrio acetivorans]
MTEQNMRRIIENYIDAYNNFDIDGMLADMDTEVDFKNYANDRVNMQVKGIDELREAAEMAAELFSTRSQTIKSFSFEPDKAEIEIDYYGVLAVDVPNGPKAGTEMHMEGRSIFRFQDGFIVSLEDFGQ